MGGVWKTKNGSRGGGAGGGPRKGPKAAPRTTWRSSPWGMGEIGKNITVFRFRDEIFVLDGGLAFPEEGMPGVDLLIPGWTTS